VHRAIGVARHQLGQQQERGERAARRESAGVSARSVRVPRS
jgi:hypothetical protein